MGLMERTLFLYVTPNTPEITWVLKDAYDTLLGPQASALADVAPACQEYRPFQVIAILAGERVLSLMCDIPAKSMRDALKAAPFVVEDNLSQPIEETHLTVIKQSETHQYWVLATDQAALATTLATFDEADLTPQIMLPDYALLPKNTCVQMGARVIHRDASTGFACSETLYPELTSARNLADAPSMTSGSFLQEFVHTPVVCNLLHGKFQPKEQQQNWQGMTKMAGLSIAACLVFILGYFLVAGLYFNHQSQQREQEALALFQELLPHEKKIINIRSQMKGYLNSGNQTTNATPFFQYLNLTAEALKNAGNKLTLRQLRYNSEGNSMQLEMLSPEMGALSDLQQSLNNHGLVAKIASANTDRDQVIGRIDVKQP